MRKVVPATREITPKRLLTAALVVSVLLVVALSQGACLLTLETPRYYNSYNSYTCRATLMDTSTGELRPVVSTMLSTSAPGAADRRFLDYDWNDNDVMDVSDAVLDWRRYLRNEVSTSTNFNGRSWCVNPAAITCTDPTNFVWRSLTDPVALPVEVLPNCSGITGPQLEVTAPGLSTDSQLTFPDSSVGTTSSPSVLITVTNRSAVSLRVNEIALMPGTDMSDFVKSADTCAPTSAELIAGRGHLLGSGSACTFQIRFAPQHRDGVPECSPTSPNDSCRRTASLNVTGEEDSTRGALRPVIVSITGRAIGGGLSIEPREVCFASAPALGICTPYQNLRITNTGVGDLTLTSARLTRAGNRWEATMPFLMPLTLNMGLSIDVPVRFCNSANDPTDGEFTINSSSPTNPTTVVTLVNPLNRRCP